jgi:RecB family exonuclease
MPLTGMQEHQLWQLVQGADRNRVVAPDRMAELAQQAYGLLGAYRAHPQRVSATASLFGDMHEDAERFFTWAASFDRLCQQNGWISRTRLEERLMTGLDSLQPPPELCLVGFDREMPAQSSLITTLEGAGTKVTRFVPETAGPAEAPVLVQARDSREELEACAWWCRAQLADSAGKTGCRRIGIIVPVLDRVRAEIDRVFCRILMPGLTLWGSAEASKRSDPELPYEFSLGSPLGSLPLVKAALLMLRWLQAPLAPAEFTSLVTSGYLAASPPEQLELAKLDAELRRRGRAEILLDSLLPSLPTQRPDKRSRLPKAVRERLSAAQARAVREGIARSSRESASRQRASYAHWAEVVPHLLADAGWPGYREVDSFAYQAQQRWNRLLTEVAALGFHGSQPSWGEFLRTLEAQARSVIFAAESTSAPIQVLGAFESSGQSFDAIWFLGVDDSHWPSVGRPHPLLPGWLQRETEMPHASADTDWRLARQTTARICNGTRAGTGTGIGLGFGAGTDTGTGAGAPSVILSYPLQEQGVTLRVSPLALEHAGPVTTPAAAIIRRYAATANALPVLDQAALERVDDDSGRLPWPAGEPAGGADILKRQAACAFQSFATRRLQATPLEEAVQGLDARERGNLLHKVLASLWAPDGSDPMRLHRLADLHAKNADELAALLTWHIEEAFRDQRAEAGEDSWQHAYLANEQRRVHARITDWLALERGRRPFSIHSIETDLRDITVGDLHLRVRPDRVDTLADGSHLLIDYKTGKVNASDWNGDRPREPQLPVYALFGGVDRVSGVAFAQIRADETTLMARAENLAGTVSEQLGKVPEKNRFDDEVRDQWRDALLSLAEQFLEGDARVNPRDEAKTCKYCPLAGVCRVHASGLWADEDEPGEDRA